MDVERFKQKLLTKEKELVSDLDRIREETRAARGAEVEDQMDEVSTEEGNSVSVTESNIDSDTLTQVRDALRRVQDGTYGTCIDCGRQIEPARLEAVPWTPYCLADAEKHEASLSNA